MYYVGINIAKLNHFASVVSQTARYSLSRSNLRMTMMASVRCSPHSHHTNAAASSLVLNRRHTMLTTWLNFSYLSATRSASSTRSRLP